MSKTIDVTVGKHDSSVSYLTTSDFRILEYPSALLPNDIKTGTILKITIAADETLEKQQNDDFMSFQNSLLQNLSNYTTKPPVLKIKSKLQTSITLSWDQFELGVSCLKNVTIWHKSLDAELFNDGNVDEDELSQVATIYNTTSNVYKMSGLNIESQHAFQLRIDTSNGLYKSDVVVGSTLSSKDFSGFNICIGALSTGKVTIDDVRAVADALCIEHVNRICNEDTTHFLTDVADDENEVSDIHLLKAKDLNIPIVTPNWLQGCVKENKLLGVKGFYYKLKEDDPSNLVEKYPFDKEFTAKFSNNGDEIVDENEAVEKQVAEKEQEVAEEPIVEEKEEASEDPVVEEQENIAEEPAVEEEEEQVAAEPVVEEAIKEEPVEPENDEVNIPTEEEQIEIPQESITPAQTVEEPVQIEATPEPVEPTDSNNVAASLSPETPSSISLTPVSTSQSKKSKGKKKKNNKKKK